MSEKKGPGSSIDRAVGVSGTRQVEGLNPSSDTNLSAINHYCGRCGRMHKRVYPYQGLWYGKACLDDLVLELMKAMNGRPLE